MKPDEVKRLAHRGEKDGARWILAAGKQNIYTDEFREASHRIGRGDAGGVRAALS